MPYTSVHSMVDSKTLDLAFACFAFLPNEQSFGRVEIGGVTIATNPSTPFTHLADTLERLARELRANAMGVRLAAYYRDHPDEAPTPEDERAELHDKGYDDAVAS